MSVRLDVIEGSGAAAPATSGDGVSTAFERLHRASRAAPFPPAREREDRLERLERVLQSRQEEIVAAVDADFGGRSRHETLLAEVFSTLQSIRFARRHLAEWMRPRRVPGNWMLRPAQARVELQPLGVVGVISPWNYPVNLALVPLAEAMAAGNRVLLKPSELTPRTAELLRGMLAEAFTVEEAEVVTGGPEVARALAALPLDHLVFTGSTRVGRLVAKAAAENLVPVTLELGGKSPALVHPDYPVAHAADRIAAGKFFNAGQTCIAPDYVLVHESRLPALAEALREVVRRRFLDAGSPDYTSIATTAGLERLRVLVAEAEAAGARVETLLPAAPGDSRRLPPMLVTGAPEGSRLLQEEIFGPILPLVPYRALDEAVAFVNARPRPLALYLFDEDAGRAGELLRRMPSGGACVNDTIFHFSQEHLPFGGVGASGTGAYHGQAGFERFSHARGIHVGSRLSPAARLMSPPYGGLLDRALRRLIGGRVRRPGE